LKFRVDSSGAPVAVRVGPHSEFHERPIVIARFKDEAQVGELRSKSGSRDGVAALGQHIERAVVACEVLDDGEFALTTYALSTQAPGKVAGIFREDCLLLVPTTLACWGPGQTVLPSFGSGPTTYNLVGGVVLRNL
jgi:hypothetical protein